MEDVVAGKLFSRRRHHLLPADDADIVSVRELFGRGIGIEGVHVVDGASGENDIIERLLEGSHGEVHGADCEERKGVDAHHDHEEENVEEDLDEANDKLSVQHEDCLALPGSFTVEVNGVEEILDQGVDNDGNQDGVLKTKHQLDAGSLGESAVVSVLDEQSIQGCKEDCQRQDPEMEQDRYDRTPLHEVNPFLSQPVERLQEQQESEQSNKLGREVILENGESQAGFSHGVPRPFHEMFKFCSPELSKEYFPHEFSHENDHDESLDVDDGHAGVGLGDVDNTRVELLPLEPSISYDRCGEAYTGHGEHCGPHPGPFF